MNDYHVVFSMSQGDLPTNPILFFYVVGSVLLLLCIGLFFAKRNSEIARGIRIILLGLGLGCFVVAISFKGLQSNYDGLADNLENGNALVTEGVVENFHPMPVTGHDSEHFTVKGNYFSYSDFEVTGAFNNSSSHGGPIREGLNVRITYLPRENRNLILRIETEHATN